MREEGGIVMANMHCSGASSDLLILLLFEELEQFVDVACVLEVFLNVDFWNQVICGEGTQHL